MALDGSLATTTLCHWCSISVDACRPELRCYFCRCRSRKGPGRRSTQGPLAASLEVPFLCFPSGHAPLPSSMAGEQPSCPSGDTPH